MAKKNTLSIVTAWNWFINITDTNILSSSEQLVLIHLIKFINRNFWKPIKIEPQILAKSTNKDNRTVKKALSTLINRGFITLTKEGGYFIGIEPIDKQIDNSKSVSEYFDFNTTDSKPNTRRTRTTSEKIARTETESTSDRTTEKETSHRDFTQYGAYPETFCH